MLNNGERQVAPTLDGIRRDHVARYEFSAKVLQPNSQVIDYACGIGYGAFILANAGHTVQAFDLDDEAIYYAREKYLHGSPGRANFLKGDAKSPVIACLFDAAVCFETIEHIDDPRPLLKALHAAAPLLIASVPNETVFPWRNYAFHFRHYTQMQFESLLNECGWQVTEWHGQLGPESEVERDCLLGRTLIAVATRCEPVLPAFRAEPLPAIAAPRHVAILGLGPSLDQYTGLARRAGGRHAYCDETWGINAVGDVLTCDRIFHMDDVRIQQIRADAKPDSNIAAMLRWMKTHPGPVYTSRAHPDYRGLVEFPLQDVLNSLPPFGYFNSTAAYAVAFAIHIGVKKISLFGFDFTYENAHHAEKGRACVEFWLGVAVCKGITVSMGNASSLMDACEPVAKRLYGYDTVDVDLQVGADGITVAFSERALLPTAAEIEAEYDHSIKPKPLVTN